jgi:uncharacterized phosphosugar-binding protein
MKYLCEIQKYISKLNDTQKENITAAAEIMADAISDGKQLFSFGASHSFIITKEMVYRTGGLMLINPLIPHGMNLDVRPMTLTSQIERLEGYGKVLLENSPANSGDVLVLVSTSGRNAVAIDMALAAKKAGIKTVCITSMEYTRAVTSRHSGGRKLYELCDVVIDNCAPYRHSCVEIALSKDEEGIREKVGPVSSITGIAIANQLVVSICEILKERGLDVPVFVSANTDAGDSHNKTLLEANKSRIHYM